jgi:hypothetical protein
METKLALVVSHYDFLKVQLLSHIGVTQYVIITFL